MELLLRMRLKTKWRPSCLPVVDGTEGVELKITSSAHARLETKWRLSCLPVVDGTKSVELKITSFAHAFEKKNGGRPVFL